MLAPTSPQDRGVRPGPLPPDALPCTGSAATHQQEADGEQNGLAPATVSST